MFDLSEWEKLLTEEKMHSLYARASTKDELNFLALLRIVLEVKNASEAIQEKLTAIEHQLQNIEDIIESGIKI